MYIYIYIYIYRERERVCLVAQACPTLCNPWTVAYEAPLSMEFSRQEFWSGFPCPPPGNLPNPGIKPRSPSLQADSLPSEPLAGYIFIYTHSYI